MASSRTEALERAIKTMIGKIEQYPSTPYTNESTDSLSNAMNALAKSYEIDERLEFPNGRSRLVEVVIPEEIAEFLQNFAGWTQEDIRFHAPGIEMKAHELCISYELMLQRSRPIPPEPASTAPEDVDPARERLSPGERVAYDAIRANATPPAAEEPDEIMIHPQPDPVETPVEDREWEPPQGVLGDVARQAIENIDRPLPEA